MEEFWFSLIFAAYSFSTRIGLAIAILPMFLGRYWWVTAITILPFGVMALYCHAWTPYVWWWGAAAAVAVNVVGAFIVVESFPNG